MLSRNISLMFKMERKIAVAIIAWCMLEISFLTKEMQGLAGLLFGTL